MKIIFLDIDGVLNGQTTTGRYKTPSGFLNKPCVDAFNTLVKETGAKVVISSTWRVDKDIVRVLLEAGVVADIIGCTPILNDRFSLRGNEIHAWIVENEQLIGQPYYDFHNFVILDDDSDMLLWHKENYFRTDGYIGLTPTVAYRAARFLNRCGNTYSIQRRHKMDTQAMTRDVRARAETQLTLGKMIACLEAFPEGTKVANLVCSHSYRGYYDELAFEHIEGTRTAKSLLAECKAAIGREFEGYKGGDFVMDENTPVWLASYGKCGTKLKALYADGSVVEEADNAYTN